jgi:hypothetical protein
MPEIRCNPILLIILARYLMARKIVGRVTLAVAALVIFFRWFGGEQRADRAGREPSEASPGGPKRCPPRRRYWRTNRTCVTEADRTISTFP